MMELDASLVPVLHSFLYLCILYNTLLLTTGDQIK